MANTAFGLLSKEIQDMLSESGFEKETPIQNEAIPAILEGDNVLLISSTGSGKTEAALLPIFQMIRKASPSQGLKALYVTPLRALNRDVFRRIEHWAKNLGLAVSIRHGDTSQSDRRRQATSPPDILVTTPETLQAMLIGSRLRSNFRTLKYIIVDEIHQLSSNRRGSQLSFAMERLETIVNGKIQRVGLSATLRDAEETAKFLCGSDRQFRIVNTSHIHKSAMYSVELPLPTRENEIQSRELFVSPHTVARIERMIDLIECHERTLIFVNSRTLAEELGSRFRILGVNVGVHHGSLSREERERVEQEFKNGIIRAMVCTSTMELGIDIGEVDLTIQYMSSRQVNSLVQRVGRSGHSLTKRSMGIVLAVSPEDALESMVISDQALKGNFEPTMLLDCPLDVLAHQIAGLLMEYGEITDERIFDIAKQSHSFSSITKENIRSVLTFMERLGFLYYAEGRVTRKRKCREYYLENLSMIRDERRYAVIDATTEDKVGVLGEEFMLLHAKVGLNFVMKGRVWQIEKLHDGAVYVTPIEDPSATVPGWDGELIPLPESVAMMVGEERKKLEQAGDDASNEVTKWNVEKVARQSIFKEIKEQKELSAVPTNERIVVERYKNYLIIHSSAGDRVNATLGELFEELLLRMGGMVRHWWNDGYRILIELTTEEVELGNLVKRLFHYDDAIPGFLKGVIRKHFPFGYEMKSIAERFGALKRGRLLSGEEMRELIVKFRFTPIYDETLREGLMTKMDLERSLEILRNCERKQMEIVTATTQSPGPLAKYIMSRYADPEYSETATTSFDSMKSTAYKEIASMLCFDCGNLQEFVRLGDLPERPSCNICSSKLLAVLFYAGRFAANAFLKRKSGQKISDEEAGMLAKARRSADIVLAYGKKGVIALSVYGIGPQMASRILSRMHETEEEFYKDLLEAKLKFVETKKYWG